MAIPDAGASLHDRTPVNGPTGPGRAAIGFDGGRWSAAPSARRGPLAAALATMRPRQWIKNALVVGAAGAAGALGHDDVPVRVGLACVAFCLLASGTYAINDVRDVEEDRRHPRKRTRPVAAGELSERAAVALGALLLVAGLALCLAIRPLLLLVGASYVALTISYTMVWRRVLLLDLFAIAGGFVLRAVAGGVAAPVTLSRWFILVISAAAVLVAAGKRDAELRRTTREDHPKRDVLELYTPRLLGFILIGSGVIALFAYTMWAFALPTEHGVPWRPLTIVPFALCLARYGLQVVRGAGEAPEELLLSDRWLFGAGAVWLLVFALGVHAAAG
ncbi:MAG: decaprenyl-phosphate phosphoribosyltransferase [Solirubrobacteraceae bacterium]